MGRSSFHSVFACSILEQRRHKTTANLEAAAKAAGHNKAEVTDEVTSKLKNHTLINTAGFINGEWTAAGDLARFEVRAHAGSDGHAPHAAGGGGGRGTHRPTAWPALICSVVVGE